MREIIISALEFARHLIHSQIDLHDCPHNGFYDKSDIRCLDCEFEAECEWLVSNDEFAALGEHSLSRLTDALEFASSYVDAQVTRLEHDMDRCSCDSCVWLRGGRKLLEQAQQQKYGS